ncbi:I78 family peptidase inhibitor [Sphingomonas sp. GCM10030256]|uniref:I78 family peptidase inhibitor n=1 Tax=Sphingomonas sp. GCM10030256 TaxID=3273427 RepID=UPI00361384A6
MIRFLVPAALALSLCACATVPAPATAGDMEPQIAGDGQCRNDALDQFTGRQRSEELGAEIRRVSGAKLVQWINPDEMVTMEFRADRVRVRLDASGKVLSARCG